MSISLENVNFAYPKSPQVLTDLSFNVVEGETVMIVGHNGAGKSTLLKLLIGLLRPTSGRIAIGGKNIASIPTARLASDVCITFQNPAEQIFASTVLRETEFGPVNLKRPNPRESALAALDLLGLRDSAHVHPYDLSLAARKLLTIASAIASETPVLAFDEPTVGLSQPERDRLKHALLDLRSAGRTLLLVSHDLEFSLPFASRILVLNRGRVEFFGECEDIMNNDHVLRKSGLRLPRSFRLRQHVGLPVPTGGRPEILQKT